MNRGLVRTLIATLCLAAFLLILVIISGGEFDETIAKALGTAGLVVLYSLTGLAATSLRDKDSEWFGVIGVVASGCAFLVGTIAVWLAPEHDAEWLPRTAGVLGVLALWLGHGAFLLRSQRETDSPMAVAVRQGTVFLGFVLAVMTCAVIAGSDSNIDGRVFAVGAVLYVLGAAVGPLLRRL